MALVSQWECQFEFLAFRITCSTNSHAFTIITLVLRQNGLQSNINKDHKSKIDESQHERCEGHKSSRGLSPLNKSCSQFAHNVKLYVSEKSFFSLKKTPKPRLWQHDATESDAKWTQLQFLFFARGMHSSTLKLCCLLSCLSVGPDMLL